MTLLTTAPDPTQNQFLRESCYVGGKWIGASGAIVVTNPANNQPIGTVPALDADAAREAVAAASIALPGWKTLTGKERGTLLRRWSELMLANREDLARLLTLEQGKPLDEARGEVAYAAAYLEWFAEEARRVNGEVLTPHAGNRRLVVTRQPIGVVAAITPWNFPLAMITRKAGPALAVGCTFVVKPSDLTPFSALALAVLAEEAGIPAGVFNVITGTAAEVGPVLTGDERVRKLSFTGSTAVGKLLAAQCTGTVKRVSLELGGNAPFLVFADADLDMAVEGAMASKFRNSGQTCVCANRFLVERSVQDAFARKLAERVANLVVGCGLSGTSDQGPLIDARAVAKVQAHVDDAVARGGALLTGGVPHAAGANFFTPTVVVNAQPDALFAREETFGPLAGIIPFDSEEEAVRLANDTRAGLAAYVFTNNAARQWRMAEVLEYGMVSLNSGVLSTEVLPFGGIKESGQGREGSHYGLDDYLEIKVAAFTI